MSDGPRHGNPLSASLYLRGSPAGVQIICQCENCQLHFISQGF